MGIDLKALDRSIRLVQDEIERKTIERMQKAVLAIDAALVLATPVDTGRARANWLPSINKPRTVKLKRGDKSGSGALAKAQRLVSEIQLGDTFYISNNLEYIGVLNDGHSQQAPAGFVEKAIQVAEGI